MIRDKLAGLAPLHGDPSGSTERPDAPAVDGSLNTVGAHSDGLAIGSARGSQAPERGACRGAVGRRLARASGAGAPHQCPGWLPPIVIQGGLPKPVTWTRGPRVLLRLIVGVGDGAQTESQQGGMGRRLGSSQYLTPHRSGPWSGRVRAGADQRTCRRRPRGCQDKSYKISRPTVYRVLGGAVLPVTNRRTPPCRRSGTGRFRVC
jgi:hypothetical protein